MLIGVFCLGARPVHVKKVAAIVTVYHHNSHADIIVSRLLQTDTLDGKGNDSPLQLVSLYTDQKPGNDISRMLAASHRFPIHETIEDALTLGTGRLAVDGVLIVGEHGNYPRTATGNTRYPKRRFWEATLAVFKASGRVVPVFFDKHLADNWQDAKWIYDTAARMQVPMIAGSSLPITWRRPAIDVKRGCRIDRIVAVTYGSTDSYGFHALELVQALAEQRAGGETGLKFVRCLSGDAVWEACDARLIDPDLFQAAMDRAGASTDGLPERVKQPLCFCLEYADGLHAYVLELNGVVSHWSAAWRLGGSDRIESTQAWTQEGRPGMHFTYLLHGIERLMLTGEPTWPLERTLLTSGALDALLISKVQGGRHLATPHLELSYTSNWRWKQPPPPPVMRPWSEQ